jgi:hypothetical protein
MTGNIIKACYALLRAECRPLQKAELVTLMRMPSSEESPRDLSDHYMVMVKPVRICGCTLG